MIKAISSPAYVQCLKPVVRINLVLHSSCLALFVVMNQWVQEVYIYQDAHIVIFSSIYNSVGFVITFDTFDTLVII